MANKKRLTDVDRLINSIQLSIASWSRDCNSNAPVIVRTYKEVLSRLENAPIADAVEVVRCKNCAYAKNNYLAHGLCLCEKPEHHVVTGEAPRNTLMCEDDFCSYGERRTDGAQQVC